MRKNRYSIWAAGLAALFLAILSIAFPAAAAAETYSVSRGEIVMEVGSERVLFEKDADKQLPMASTTKILTAIIIIEDCDLDETVEVPAEAAGREGSSVYLVAGEKLTVRDLLYGLMLRSGNDCAETLAIHHSGSVAEFAACMTERAKKIGASDSCFKNPHGLPQDGHYTTARDLGLIAVYAMRNPIFVEIVSAKTWKVPDGGCGYARTFVNKNKMLYNYDGADGVKTGYTKEAGRCLVTSAEKNGMRLVSVVLNSPSMYERSAQLLDGCFAKYHLKTFGLKGTEYSVATEAKAKTCTGVCEEDFSYPLTEEEEKCVRVETSLPKELKLPVKKGDQIGKVDIYLKNQLLFSQKIVSILNVEKSYLDILQEILR